MIGAVQVPDLERRGAINVQWDYGKWRGAQLALDRESLPTPYREHRIGADYRLLHGTL